MLRGGESVLQTPRLVTGLADDRALARSLGLVEPPLRAGLVRRPRHRVDDALQIALGLLTLSQPLGSLRQPGEKLAFQVHGKLIIVVHTVAAQAPLIDFRQGPCKRRPAPDTLTALRGDH